MVSLSLSFSVSLPKLPLNWSPCTKSATRLIFPLLHSYMALSLPDSAFNPNFTLAYKPYPTESIPSSISYHFTSYYCSAIPQYDSATSSLQFLKCHASTLLRLFFLLPLSWCRHGCILLPWTFLDHPICSAHLLSLSHINLLWFCSIILHQQSYHCLTSFLLLCSLFIVCLSLENASFMRQPTLCPLLSHHQGKWLA